MTPLARQWACSSRNSPSESCASCTPCTSTPNAAVSGLARILVGLDVGVLHHGAPLADLVGDDLAERLGAGAARFGALLEELGLHFRPRHHRGDRLVHARH